MYFEPEQYKKIAWYLYGFGVFLLVFLYFAPGGEGQIAEMQNNVKRWLNLPVIWKSNLRNSLRHFSFLEWLG